MGRYVADVKFIASIYPGQLDPIFRNYGVSQHSAGPGASRGTNFRLQPVARGEKPFVLAVYDSYEDLIDFNGIAAGVASGNAQKPRIGRPVPVESIVEDLLRHWTGGLHNVPAGAAPGIIEISPMDVELKKWKQSGFSADALPGPSPRELDQMLGMQTRYFEFWFNEGERLHAEKKWDQIGIPHRLAAEWLGHRRTWATGDVARNTEPCPLCQEMISREAIFCPVCKQQIRKMPAELAALTGAGPATARL